MEAAESPRAEAFRCVSSLKINCNGGASVKPQKMLDMATVRVLEAAGFPPKSWTGLERIALVVKYADPQGRERLKRHIRGSDLYKNCTKILIRCGALYK
jgi:hypothetical protein